MSPGTKILRVLVGVDFDDASGAKRFGRRISTTVHRTASRTRGIVLSMAANVGAHGRFGAIVQVLKECVDPVLFVPSTDGIVERSSS